MAMTLVGRRHEREVLEDALASPRAELIAVYDRRRVVLYPIVKK